MPIHFKDFCISETTSSEKYSYCQKCSMWPMISSAATVWNITSSLITRIWLLEEHITKSHIKRTVAKVVVDGTVGCKCVYPCIPMKPKVEAPVTIITGQQWHCALQDAPACKFQCGTKAQLNNHIKKAHRNKTQLQCTVCNLYLKKCWWIVKAYELDSQKKLWRYTEQWNKHVQTHLQELPKDI